MLLGLLKSASAFLIAISLSPAQIQHSYRADPIASGQWYVGYLNLKSTHQLSTGKGIIVAVIDTGVDANHPSLSGSVLPGADFSLGSDQSAGDGHTDLDGHGTGMASLIAGHGLIHGVAPGAKILPVRVKATPDSGGAAQVAIGINWAVDNGANVINVSLASAVKDPREQAAVNRALAKDVVVVAGAGNLPAMATVQFPAGFPGVVAVASVGASGEHTATSVPGSELTISAPGEKLSIASRAGGYALATGTSGAAAIVSGVAALVCSREPGIGVNDVIHRLTSSAIDRGAPGKDELFGYGIVNPHGALVSVQESALRASAAGPALDGTPLSQRPEVSTSVLEHAGYAVLGLALVGLSVLLTMGLVLRNRRR